VRTAVIFDAAWGSVNSESLGSMRCLFASDLHGRPHRYAALWHAVAQERPDALLLGGDLGPGPGLGGAFVRDDLGSALRALHGRLGAHYPRVLVVPGNDDERIDVPEWEALARDGLCEWVHGRSIPLGEHHVYGYACVPPTPFALKDWERYDVSRFVEAGCVSPEEGRRTVAVTEGEMRWTTIASDLVHLAGTDDLSRAVFLFHAPPYRTVLDRAALDGRSIDHAPVDVHVGSIAIRRFIEKRQPLVTLHGHVHESVRLTGSWREQLGRTWMLGAAHDGPELALVTFDPADPGGATRRLL
jgi:Icc-related predicted phosphoesterase